MATILSKIVKTKLEELEILRQKEPEDYVRKKASARSESRGFKKALLTKNALGLSGVIAEIKRASPSKGLIREDFDPSFIARSYEKGGAACLSVLTDVNYFQGSSKYLIEARESCRLPVLRKDFVIDAYQIYEAAAWEADAVLLISAILSQEKMLEFNQIAQDNGLDVLVESHNEEELGKALALPGALIGINNRNLEDFTVDLNTTIRLKAHVEEGRTLVTESGILTKEDAELMRSHGIENFLIGEMFMRQPDPGEKLKDVFFKG